MWSAVLSILYKIVEAFVKSSQKKEITTYEGNAEINNTVTRDDLLDRYGGLSEDCDSENESESDTGKPE